MAMDMRALYTIALSAVKESPTAEDDMKANENCLNQNFIILTQKIEELEARLRALESGNCQRRKNKHGFASEKIN